MEFETAVKPILELVASPNVGKLWQWLAELLERDPDPGNAAGAHVSYSGQLRR